MRRNYPNKARDMRRGRPSLAGTMAMLAVLAGLAAAVSYPRIATGVALGVGMTLVLRRLYARLAERRRASRTESENNDRADGTDRPARARLANGRGQCD
jgi:hypothetical protein